MPSGLAGPEAAQVLQWMEAGPAVFAHVHRLLHAYDQATEAARAAQAERERLLQEGEALRDQVRQIHAELVRLQKERAKLARWFTFKVEEAAWRFPPPPA